MGRDICRPETVEYGLAKFCIRILARFYIRSLRELRQEADIIEVHGRAFPKHGRKTLVDPLQIAQPRQDGQNVVRE